MVLLLSYQLKTSPHSPADRPIDRIAENVDDAFDDTDVTDFLAELNWAEHARAEDSDW